jgi:hypothetical protein
MTQFLKRRANGDSKVRDLAAQTVEAVDAAFAKKYPALAEFLSAEEWGPGEPRERGTLTLFFEQGAFKACVSDRDANMSAFVAKSAFLGLLEAVEKGLQGDSLDWRGQKGKPQGKGKRS